MHGARIGRHWEFKAGAAMRGQWIGIGASHSLALGRAAPPTAGEGGRGAHASGQGDGRLDRSSSRATALIGHGHRHIALDANRQGWCRLTDDRHQIRQRGYTRRCT